MTRPRFAMLIAVAGLVLSATAAPVRATLAEDPLPPVPAMYYIGHAAGEPTIGIDKDGTVFITANDGCLTSCTGSTEMLDQFQQGAHAVLASRDGGQTWTDVSPKAGPAWVHVFSLDPYLYLDEITGRIFNIDLNIACSHMSFTDNGGASWTTTPLGCGEPVNDHQTVFAGPAPAGGTQPIGYPNVVYYCFNHPAFTKCSKSLTGGLVWQPTTSLEMPSCSGLNGHGIVDKQGTIYIPLGANCGAPNLAISRDEGETWDVVEVASMSASDQDPSVAIDQNGVLYYLFVQATNNLPYLVTSSDGGTTWSTPRMVGGPGIRAVNLATLDVGAPGKVAIAYYGTTTTTGTKLWNGYLAMGRDVLSEQPLWFTLPVNDPAHPLKIGSCGPGRCGRVLDFIDVEISPSGQPFGAYVDACLQTCETTKAEQITDNQGVVGTLIGGFSLR